MSVSTDEFATAVRKLPLSTDQLAIAGELLATAPPGQLPNELVRREVLTEYQASMILAGRGAELAVGRYVILDELGGGGMGQVFKARDTAMDRVIALKLIRPDWLANEAAALRFRQEVKAAARLAHPNIVRAYDAGTTDGKHYLVTELVGGHDLGEELRRRGALPPGEACEYARQTAIGLQQAFEQGLIHRDIKPSNLLFDTSERVVKIADFGLARLTESAGHLTVDGSAMGTPDYIAPEQATSATTADIRSDLYSLGCTLYHFLAGHVPFPGLTATAKLLSHADREPESLDTECPGLNPGLTAVVQKLMAKNPADRYQTPADVVAALAPFCPKLRPGEASLAPEPSPSTRALGETAVTPARRAADGPDTNLPPSEARPASRPVWRTRALAGVVLVLAAAITLPFAFGACGSTPPPGTVPVVIDLGGWKRANDPQVVLYLDGPGLSGADRAQPLTLNELKRLELRPGHYRLQVKEGETVVESGGFEVTAASAGDTIIVASTVGNKPPVGTNPGQGIKLKLVRSVGAEGPVTDVVCLPDGKGFVSAEVVPDPPKARYPEYSTKTTIYSFEKNRVGGWKSIGGFQVAVVDRGTKVVQAAKTFGTKVFVAGTVEPYYLHTWNVESGAYTEEYRLSDLAFASCRVSVLVASPDGSRVLLGKMLRGQSRGTMVEFQLRVVEEQPDAKGVAPKFTWKNKYEGTAACFGIDADHILVANRTKLSLLDADRKTLAEYSDAPAVAISVAMSGDGRQTAAGCTDGSVCVWGTDTRQPGTRLTGHTGAVNAVAFTRDGKYAISAGEDGTVRVWDPTAKAEVTQSKHDGPVNAIAVSRSGNIILTAGADKQVCQWELEP